MLSRTIWVSLGLVAWIALAPTVVAQSPVDTGNEGGPGNGVCWGGGIFQYNPKQAACLAFAQFCMAPGLDFLKDVVCRFG